MTEWVYNVLTYTEPPKELDIGREIEIEGHKYILYKNHTVSPVYEDFRKCGVLCKFVK